MWPDIMLEDLYQPLGMVRTFLRKTEVEDDGDYALSYGMGVDDLTSGQQGPTAMDDVPDPAFSRPAGLAWTTPTQMMAWADFVMNGDTTVLSDGLRSEITAEHVDTLYPPGIMHYGYGMFVQQGYLTSDEIYYHVPVWQHAGNTLSFTNELYMLPEQDFAVVITSSGYGTDFSHSLDVAITTLVDLPEPSPTPEVVVDPSTFHRHVGDYHDSYNVGDVTVTQQGSVLNIEMPTLAQAGYQVSPVLMPISSDMFIVTIDGQQYDITFVPTEPNGDSAYIRNRVFVVTRVAQAPAGQAAIQPTGEAIDRWLNRAATHAPGPRLGPVRVRR
ncbi:MAG: hypothetical protein DRI90_21085 [Deltaproteobacteria bacterium]|nr:MAG: hypothetical protein DRI90_21085 [Deltaproteobacteria bacterium]